MRTLIISIIILFAAVSVKAEDTTKFSFSIGKWNMKVISQEHLFPTYLADPLAPRFEVSSQKMLYSDVDYQDEINQGGDYLGKLYINAGARISLFQFRPKSNPKLGIGIELGLGMPVYMRHGNHDLMAFDGVYHFSISLKPREDLHIRLSKHHICAHRGDEYNRGGVDSPVDFDPNQLFLYVRDDYTLSAAYRPFYKSKNWDILQVYGDFIFFLPGKDFMGTRQNKPSRHAYLAYQTGAEIEYYLPYKFIGGFFTAMNVSAYQLNAWSPNYSFVAGYIFPQDKGKNRLRIGVNYYDGRAINNEFYNRKERFIAFIVGMDL